METQKEHFRFYTFMTLKLEDNGKKILQDLQAVFGVQCLGKSTVYRWIEAFLAEQEPSTSGTGRGRPLSARNERNIALVKSLIDEDPHSTIRELSEACDLSIGTIHSILHEDLQMRNLAARWVPHLLTDEQKKRRVDCSR